MRIFVNREYARIVSPALGFLLISLLPNAVGAQEKKANTPPHPTHTAPPPVQQQRPVQRTAQQSGAQRNMPAAAPQTPRANQRVEAPGSRPQANQQPAANQRPPNVYQQPRPNVNQRPRPNPNGAAPVNPNQMRGPETFRPPNRPEGTYAGGISGARNGAIDHSGRTALHDFHGPNNMTAAFHSDGRPRFVQAKGISIVHGPSGARHIIAERPDHTVIVANGAGHGYVQRPFAYLNATFVNRTYYVHGAPFTRVYRPYAYRGVILNTYVPTRYYALPFYGWVSTPWRAPVVYGWAWAGSPWATYYGPYFAPAPVYPSASLWLADYLVSNSLEAAYEDVADAKAAPMYSEPSIASTAPDVSAPISSPITLEVRQAIANEVERQVLAEKSMSQAPTPGVASDPALDGLAAELNDNNSHAFVVAATLNVTSTSGQECSLTQGDVLQLNAPPPANSAGADALVLASKGQDCRQGASVTVSVQDLQEMQNQMRAAIDQGMMELEAHKNGLPAPPANAVNGVVEASFVSTAPRADPDVAVELKQQAQQAEEVEKQVLAQATAADSAGIPASGAGDSATLTIAAGQTVSQVVALKGPPSQIANVGPKQIYVYADMKITFMNGRIADVQ